MDEQHEQPRDERQEVTSELADAELEHAAGGLTKVGAGTLSFQTGGSGHSDLVPVDQVSLN